MINIKDDIKSINEKILNKHGLIRRLHYDFINSHITKKMYVHGSQFYIDDIIVEYYEFNNLDDFCDYIKKSCIFVLIYENDKFGDNQTIFRYKTLYEKHLTTKQLRFLKVNKIKNNKLKC